MAKRATNRDDDLPTPDDVERVVNNRLAVLVADIRARVKRAMEKGLTRVPVTGGIGDSYLALRQFVDETNAKGVWHVTICYDSDPREQSSDVWLEFTRPTKRR